jgi:hypothetical protein
MARLVKRTQYVIQMVIRPTEADLLTTIRKACVLFKSGVYPPDQ